MLNKTQSIFFLFLLVIQSAFAKINADSCNTSILINVKNLGVYGGRCTDLAFSFSDSRLFAISEESPLSLFYTDDSCNIWHQAFAIDSLSYECEQRGWGGGGKKVLTNTKGWIAVQTNISSVISFENGNKGSWKTAMDPILLNSLGYNDYSVNSIALSEDYMFIGLGPVLVKLDSMNVNSSNCNDLSQLISGIDSTDRIISIAAASDTLGEKFYAVIDTALDGIKTPTLLYQYNSGVIIQLSLPSQLYLVDEVFVPLKQKSLDTLFISGINNSNNAVSFISYNAGITWTEISWVVSGTHIAPLTDVDYSDDWKALTTGNTGIILIYQGKGISFDMGVSISTIDLGSGSLVVHPDDTNMVIKSLAQFPFVSQSGKNGPYNAPKNDSLTSIQVNKIDRTENKTVFYIATTAGLGYTIAYLDSMVKPIDKWLSPYGEFPVKSAENESYSAVAINPYDSLNVVAGYSQFISVTVTGFQGFSSVQPFGSNEPPVNDILFADSVTVIAITGGSTAMQKGMGNIWLSKDKGYSWNKVSPAGFYSGNTLAMGSLNSTKVIYAGTGIANVDSSFLWKSVDLGNTWSKINTGPSSQMYSSFTNLSINDIGVDPRGTDTLYIIAVLHDTIAEFVSSGDGGLSYKYLDLSKIKDRHPGTYAGALAVNVTYPDTVYLAMGRTIISYCSITDSINLIYSGYPNEIIPDIASGSILAGTTTGFYGIFYDSTDDIVYTNLDENTMNKINMYPNPASTLITIETNYSSEMTIEVFDMLGKKIGTEFKNKLSQSSMFQMDIRNIPNGYYIIKVQGKNEQLVSRILINHSF